jgi:regulatory protein
MTDPVNNEKELIKTALKLLAVRDYFQEELKKKLLQKGGEESEVENVMEYVGKHNYINDVDVLVKYSAEIARKSKGFNYLKKKLFEKGCFGMVDKFDLRSFYTVKMEKQSGLNFIEKYGIKEEKEIEKKLVSRGFSYEAVFEIKQILRGS